MEISKTDILKIMKYMNDAALLYDSKKGQRYVCRAWVIRQMTTKLNKKLNHKNKSQNEKV